LIYAQAYSEDPKIPTTKYEYRYKVFPAAKALEGRVKWDKIFLLPPKNKFVDDGSRYMKQASINERVSNFNKLTELLKEFKLWDKVEILDGDFLHNFEVVKNYINKLYDE
jgi:nicotinamide riboside kinase